MMTVVPNWDFHNPVSAFFINQCIAPKTILHLRSLLLTQIIDALLKIENPSTFCKAKPTAAGWSLSSGSSVYCWSFPSFLRY